MLEEKNEISKNEETKKWNLIIGGYRVSSDSYQWLLQEVKQKQDSEGVYYNTIGYYSTMKGVFTALREHKISKAEINSIDSVLMTLKSETDNLILHCDSLEEKMSYGM